MPPRTSCAIYLRSSKDRHEVSIDVQRRQLTELAADRHLAIAAEYADTVESGKDDERPAFQRLLHDLRQTHRPWSVLLALDTSRIARRRHLAVIFEHELAKAGAEIVYRSVPDTDPITGMLLRSILQAMDEWHSLTSRAKGLAGQAENIRQGWRAGGTPPRGYTLQHNPTGAIRDGVTVTKSRLTPSDEAPRVAAYLKSRASGKTRSTALAIAGAAWPASSLHDIERHALTYAGHTVWGQSADKKRRARSEWTVQRDTHPALITDTEAEALLAELERKSGRRTRATDRPYLLSGLLAAPDGTPWSAEWDKKMDAPIYRLQKGRRVSGPRIERTVLDAVFADLAEDSTARRIAETMRRLADKDEAGRTTRRLTREIDELSRQIGRLVELAIDEPDPAPYRRAIAEKEQRRHLLVTERNEARALETQAREAAKWTSDDVRRLLAGLRAELEDVRQAGEISRLRSTLRQLVDRVEYAPGAEECRVVYRIDTGFNVALPRGRHATPVSWDRVVPLRGRRIRPGRPAGRRERRRGALPTGS